MYKKLRASYNAVLLLMLVVGLVPLLMSIPVHAPVVDQYFIYSKFDPPGVGDVVAAGGYVEDYGVPWTWGDEIQYVYFLSDTTGYKVKVWVTNYGGPTDPTTYIDIKQHPDHYDPNHIGPIEPRHFQIVSSKSLSGYTYGSSGHTEEFYVDSSGIYLGAYPYGIHKWDHDWNFKGKIANSAPTRTESMAYNPAENVWYAGGRARTIYQLRDTDSDGSFLDESWAAIFTYPSYGGGHHDGMEYLAGYLWISDMTSDVIGKWQYNATTNAWEELKRFTYSEPAAVEGMGFGPNAHFWCGSGWGSGSYIYELGDQITEGYPIAEAGPDVEAFPPTVSCEFDASGSIHTDPAKEIARYEWDFESDGIWDYNGTEPVVEHAYPAYYTDPTNTTIDWDKTIKNYTATLRVTDNGIPPMNDLDTCVMHITAPPWKPVADPDGPYNTRICHPIQLDGSGSYDPEGLMYPPDHPWYENISTYEWDLDNDGEFDDSTDMNPVWHWSVEGTYFVGLKVTDSQPSGGGGAIGPLDTDEKYTVVIVGAIHDVAVTSVTPSTSEATIGEVVAVEVVVANLGDFNETFDVSLYYDSDVIGVASAIALAPSDMEELQFFWDTTGVPEGAYTVKACADVVPGEIIVDNNCLETTVNIVEQVPVYIDIKPGSWPNPLQLKDKGVLPVAVCGTEDFDVTTIDPETVQLTLEGLGVGVAPLRWSYEDVATPYTGEPCSGHNLTGDGYLDLTLKFKAQEVIETLGLDAFSDRDVVVLILTGNLKEEHGGTPIQGQDCIVILDP